MHNNQDIGSNSSRHGVEEIGHRSPTPPTIFGGTKEKKNYGRLDFVSSF
jgi:hypothetical protein